MQFQKIFRVWNRSHTISQNDDYYNENVFSETLTCNNNITGARGISKNGNFREDLLFEMSKLHVGNMMIILLVLLIHAWKQQNNFIKWQLL